MERSIVEIFADGACSGNPGPGGYGAILKYGKTVKEISGCACQTTNNRMEMTGIIEALRLIKRPCRIRVLTDSSYVVKGMSEWVPRWIKKNWMTASKKPVTHFQCGLVWARTRRTVLPLNSVVNSSSS